MKHFHSILFVTAALGAAFFWTSCSVGGASANVNPDGRPSVLRYCFTSTMEDPEAAGKRLDLIRNYLERTLHVKVEVTKAAGYGGVVEAFRANKVDLASISPFSYILASQIAPIEAIVMRGSTSGKPGDYSGALAVPSNSPIHTVDDLVKHVHELTISFVDPESASGFLVEYAFLQSMGIEPQRDFKKVLFSMSHPASLLTLKAGKVDVAATQARMVRRYEDMGKLGRGDVRILWTSPPIPNQPMAVRKDLPPAFKEEIRRAFVNMDSQTYAGFAPKTFSSMAYGQVFVPANDAMFDGLRKVAKNVKNLSLLER